MGDHQYGFDVPALPLRIEAHIRTTCSGFIALEPVYAIMFAALLFHEPIKPWIVVSIILIVGASLTLLKIERERLPPGVE